MKNQLRKILLEPVRVGVQDGSLTDNTITDPGTEKQHYSNRTQLQVCSCGREKDHLQGV